jgi:prepilin-type N-terminal cleavage/methylation domain-containing protein
MNRLLLDKGFSLIELLVVIAIVGLLAAIAVPSYKMYVLKSKVATLRPYIESVMSTSVNYYNKNGVLPNAYQMGIFPNTNADPCQFGPCSTVGWNQPLLKGVWIAGGIPQLNGATATDLFVFFFDGTKFPGGIISTTNNNLDINSSDRISCHLNIDSNGIFRPSCATYLAIDGFAGPAGSYNLMSK